MTPGSPIVPVDVLRDAARQRVEETSLRVAAAEIGLSYSGLRTFLKGTEPYAPTLAKLRAWYVGRQESGPMTEERARAVLAALLAPIAPERRGEVLREVVEALERGYRGTGAPAPKWLRKMMAE